jgi:hypothetical protein
VAPRGNEELRRFEEYLQRPEHRAYASAIHFFKMPSQYRYDSSSEVREDIANGGGPLSKVPKGVLTFIDQIGAYKPPHRSATGELVDSYGVRLALLNNLYRTDRE